MKHLALIALLAITGCAASGLDQTIQSLNDRQLQSCIQWQGSLRAPGGHVAVNGLTVTGGMPMDLCIGINP